MKAQTTETTDNTVNTNQVDDLLKGAREAHNTWKYKKGDSETEYELFLVNQTGGASVKMIDPDTNIPVGIIGAEFAWENSEPFMEHLDFGFKDVTNLKTNEVTPISNNGIISDRQLFTATAQQGFMTELDEFGQEISNKEYTGKELREMLPDEVQSDLIEAWLGSFHISRILPKGQSKLQSLLKPESLFFEVKVGNFHKPRHVLLFEFSTPSKDVRRDWEDKAVKKNREQEGSIVTTETLVDNEYKYRFARKHFVGVQGVTVGTVGNPFKANDDAIVQQFRKGFCPYWWVKLADSVAKSFANSGKN